MIHVGEHVRLAHFALEISDDQFLIQRILEDVEIERASGPGRFARGAAPFEFPKRAGAAAVDCLAVDLQPVAHLLEVSYRLFGLEVEWTASTSAKGLVELVPSHRN